jgi:hypothetical protein
MSFEKFNIYKSHTSKAKPLAVPDVRECINLEMFLEYELRASSRYRRYLSLVLIKGVGNGSSYLKEILSENIRICDAWFFYGNYIAVLMSETDEKGSLKAIERYKMNLCNRGHDLNFAYVTYPQDGTSVDELNRVLWQRIEEHKSGTN